MGFSLKKLGGKIVHYAKASTGLPALGKLAHGDVIGALKSTVGGQALNDLGVDIAPDIKNPKIDDYMGGTSGRAQEAMRRAYEMMDKQAIREPDSITAERISQHATQGPMGVEAHNAGAIREAEADKVGAPREVVAPWLPDAQKVAAAKAGAIREADGATVGPAASTNQTQVKTTDTRSLAGDLLAKQAMGEGPSKAEALLNSGLDKVAQKQLSLAAAAKGSERRGARRGAMLAIGAQGADAAQQAAALRAEEMQKATGALASVETHAQDLKQSANSMQAQIDAAAARGDMEAVNRLKSQQAELDARSSEVNAQAQNTRTEQDTSREQRAGELTAASEDQRALDRSQQNLKVQEGNSQRDLTAREADAGRGTEVSLANARAANSRAEDLARRKDETDEQYAGRVQKWGEDNANRETQIEGQNSQNSMRAQEGNRGAKMSADSGNRSAQMSALGGAMQAASPLDAIDRAKYGEAIAERDRELAQRNAMNQMLIKGGAAIATGGASLGMEGAGAALGQQTGLSFLGGIPGLNGQKPAGPPAAGASGYGDDVMTPTFKSSDRTLKKDIKKIPGAGAVRLVDAYKKMASTYQYKDGDGATTAGVTGQALAKDPLGKTFVRRGDNGKLEVDYGGLNAALIAGLAAKMDAQAQRTAKARRAA